MIDINYIREHQERFVQLMEQRNVTISVEK